MRLVMARSLLDATFEQLRSCGDGKRECVAYWCARQDEPDRLHRVVHPVHDAGLAGYSVDSEWVTKFFLDLRQAGETVRVQVHTHTGKASHSATDDQFALAPSQGFLSLVLPDFAFGPVSLDLAHLVEMQADGSWAAVHINEALSDE